MTAAKGLVGSKYNEKINLQPNLNLSPELTLT